MLSQAQADKSYLNIYQLYLTDQAYEMEVNVYEKLKSFQIIGHRRLARGNTREFELT